MIAHVGDGGEPLASGGVDGADAVGKIQTREKVLFHVSDEVFDAPFFIGLADIAGTRLEAVMGGEVQIAGIEDGFVAEAMAQDSGLEVVDVLFPAVICGRPVATA